MIFPRKLFYSVDRKIQHEFLRDYAFDRVKVPHSAQRLTASERRQGGRCGLHCYLQWRHASLW
jgi:hypothetical protein